MGKTSAFKSLNFNKKDFRFCIELPVLAKFKKYKIISKSSYERSRLSGKKKVNELKDGFLIVVLMDFRNKGIFHSWHTDTIKYFHSNTDFKLYDTILWEMSPAKRHPLYPQSLLNRRMLNTHEYCLVFNRKTQPELGEFYDKKLQEDEVIQKNNNNIERFF